MGQSDNEKYFHRSPYGRVNRADGSTSFLASYDVYDCKACGALICFDGCAKHIEFHKLLEKVEHAAIGVPL